MKRLSELLDRFEVRAREWQADGGAKALQRMKRARAAILAHVRKLAAAEAECERLREAVGLALGQLEIVEDGESLTSCGANAIAVLRAVLTGDIDGVAAIRAALAAGKG